MSAEVTLYIAIASVAISIPSAVFSYVLHRRARRLGETQTRVITVYSTAFGEIAKMARGAMMRQGELTDYERGCKAFAYEVLWELGNCNKALGSETEPAP